MLTWTLIDNSFENLMISKLSLLWLRLYSLFFVSQSSFVAVVWYISLENIFNFLLINLRNMFVNALNHQINDDFNKMLTLFKINEIYKFLSIIVNWSSIDLIGKWFEIGNKNKFSVRTFQAICYIDLFVIFDDFLDKFTCSYKW